MTRINLLPPEERAKAAREQGLVLVVLGVVVLVVVLSAAYLLTFRQVSSKQDKLTSADADIAAVTKQIQSLSAFETLQSQRDAMQTMARDIYDSRVQWSSILEEISLVIPENCSLTQITAAVPAQMSAGSGNGTTGAAAPSATEKNIVLAGVAKSQTDVADFMTRLGLLPQLTGIVLRQSTVDAEVGCTFEIDVDLKPFLTPAPNAAGGTTTTTTTTPSSGG